MISLSQKQIKEIAQELQVGMNVYINRDTLEIKSIYDYGNSLVETDFWEEEERRINKEWKNYSVIVKMDPSESFKIMEDFIAELNDKEIEKDLINALNQKRPFANFKYIIEASEYRQKWFDFKDLKMESYVTDQLELANYER